MKKPSTVSRPAGQRTACAYVRVSVEDRIQQQSWIERQVTAVQAWCALNNVVLVDIYREVGSKRPGDDRPEFQRMLDRATSPDRPYDVVVVWSLSRLTRDLRLQIVSLERLKAAGVACVSVGEIADSDTGADLLRSDRGGLA